MLKIFSKNHSNNQLKTIFIDEQYIDMDKEEIVDVILSPKYYWVKIEKLPVKFSFQAKEYSNSIFDGNIPDANYSYKVIKNGENFVFLAYDIGQILDNLNKLGINQSKIRDVYFAQLELQDHKSIKIDDSNALILHNKKIIKTPLSLVENYENLSDILSHIKLSNHKIKLGKFNQIYEQKSAFGIMIVMILLILIYVAEIFYLKNNITKEDIKKEDIVKKYSLPNTKIQLNAISNQYEKIEITQTNLRAKINEIFNLQFLEDEYISDLKISNKKVILAIHMKDKNRVDYYKQNLEKYLKIDSFRDNFPNIEFEMSYE